MGPIFLLVLSGFAAIILIYVIFYFGHMTGAVGKDAYAIKIKAQEEKCAALSQEVAELTQENDALNAQLEKIQGEMNQLVEKATGSKPDPDTAYDEACKMLMGLLDQNNQYRQRMDQMHNVTEKFMDQLIQQFKPKT